MSKEPDKSYIVYSNLILCVMRVLNITDYKNSKGQSWHVSKTYIRTLSREHDERRIS